MLAQTRLQRASTEFYSLLKLATPIIIAQLANTAMGFVDTVMAGRVSPQDLAAVALGNSIWVPVFLLMTGILLATTPKVAQRFGAGAHTEIGPLVRQALWLALAVGIAAAVILWNAEIILSLMNVDPALIKPAMGYLRAVACGFPAVALYHVLRCFSDGLGHTRPSMVIGLCGLALNIPLNYIFIYGKLGLPAMGGVGCGWATALVMGFMFLSMLWWVKWAPFYQPSKIFSHFEWPQWPVLKRLLSVGLPIGISVFAESSIFAVIALLIGGLGATVVAGHQIALNFSSMVFMIPYSLGMAATVRVGQALGRGQPRAAVARTDCADLYPGRCSNCGSHHAAGVFGAVSVLRCHSGHRSRCAARLSGHPRDHDPDSVCLLGHRLAGGLCARPDRLVRRAQRPQRALAGSGGRPALRGRHARRALGRQRAQTYSSR